MVVSQCSSLCGQSVKQQTAFKSRQSRPAKLVVRSQISPVQAAKQARDAAASLAATFSAAALLLALPADAANGPTLFDSNSNYQQELQDLIDARGGLKNFSPQEAAKSIADKASDKASDAAKFTLDKDLPISKGTIDSPDTILEKALPEAAKNIPLPSSPSADIPKPDTPSAPSAPSLPKPKLEAPSLPSLPKVEAPKVEAPSLPSPPQTPKLEAPKAPSVPTPSVPTPSLPSPSVPSPPTPELPQQPGGGLPTPYLAAGGVAALAILGIGLTGAKPDNAAPAESPVSKTGGGSSSSSSSQSKGSSSGGSSSLPDGKDPELDSNVAKKQDPFFKEVEKRTKN